MSIQNVVSPPACMFKLPLVHPYLALPFSNAARHGFAFSEEHKKPQAAGAGASVEEEAMDTTTSAASLPQEAQQPRSPAIATKNTTHQQAFPGTQNRPPHLQML